MKRIYSRQLLLVCVASLLFQICSITTRGQQQSQDTPQPEQQEQDEDVIRISTELVQTGVSVFDKNGRFVEGLKKEDFELKVDGKPVEIGFFERVSAGTAREEAQVVAVARGDSPAKIKDAGKDASVPSLTGRGRVIIFFVDDIHIAPENLKSARDTITRFIDNEMGPNDLVAIASPSGQIGFLQQYTNNKEVLKKAVARLSYKNFGARDMVQPMMTDNQALLIDQGDRDVMNYFVQLTVKIWNVTPSVAVSIVTQRARILLQQSAQLSKATLSALETLSRRAAGLPGRKLVFFISDGFPLDTRNSDTPQRIRGIVDASIRSGVVIYTVNARGLVTDMMDATVEMPFDPQGRMVRALHKETTAGEDVLNAVAADTGGRFIHNTNDFGPDVTKALKETSAYYLLAWRPAEEGGDKKFRSIKVSIKNRPKLSVKVQRGYFEATPEVKQKEQTSAKAAPPADPLRKAINSLLPKGELPTRLALNYMDTSASGSTLVASMKVEADALKFEQHAGKTAAVVDIAGTVFDAHGKALDSFSHRLTVTPPSSAEARPPDIIYNHRAMLKPGLYQVRVAALDRSSGQTGSATEWVEIPDLSKQGLAMSSLIVAERKLSKSAAEKKSDALVEGVPVSVDHRFERSSNLRFLVYIYNAARAAAANAQPDVTLQVRILRDGQPAITMPPSKLSPESQDPTRLAYAAEIPLQGMRTGQYVLQVTATDSISKASASQSVRFEVQ
ncbi:MAG TPA: VWA domain-containing protein [Pyrinomonadaceae bacterium]|nr:VWA domain-containing protein [Pyrinomonadaceae bacterium]